MQYNLLIYPTNFNSLQEILIIILTVKVNLCLLKYYYFFNTAHVRWACVFINKVVFVHFKRYKKI